MPGAAPRAGGGGGLAAGARGWRGRALARRARTAARFAARRLGDEFRAQCARVAARGAVGGGRGVSLAGVPDSFASRCGLAGCCALGASGPFRAACRAGARRGKRRDRGTLAALLRGDRGDWGVGEPGFRFLIVLVKTRRLGGPGKRNVNPILADIDANKVQNAQKVKNAGGITSKLAIVYGR